MIVRKVHLDAPMAVLCQEARYKMNSTRCFNPACDRCWPTAGPLQHTCSIDIADPEDYLATDKAHCRACTASEADRATASEAEEER